MHDGEEMVDGLYSMQVLVEFAYLNVRLPSTLYALTNKDQNHPRVYKSTMLQT